MANERTENEISEANIKEQERIIATLCVDASDPVRDCLRKYNPRKQAWQIQAAFKQCKKTLLVDTLEYLGIPGMVIYKLDTLALELTCRIQNLFPDVCQFCNKSYCIKLTDKPIM